MPAPSRALPTAALALSLAVTALPALEVSRPTSAAAATTATTRAATKITVDATPDTLGRGERTLVEGELYRVSNYAPLPSRLVRLQRRPLGSTSAWVTYAKVSTDTFGRFKHRRTADRSMEFRAYYAGSRVYAPAASFVARTRVRPGTWTNISAWVNSTNGRATVKGRLRRSDTGAVLPSKSVVVHRRKPYSMQWTRIGERRTGSTGLYQLTDTRLVRECYIYRATFGGTSVYSGKSARTTWRAC